MIPDHILIKFDAQTWLEVPIDINKITASQLYLYLKHIGVMRIADVPLYKCKKAELLRAFQDLFGAEFQRFRLDPELEELELTFD